jgi:hypothetical protein
MLRRGHVGGVVIVVIGTTGNPPPGAAERWHASVFSQEEVNLGWYYLDLPERPASGFPHFPALIEYIGKLRDETIIVSLDGDDWLLPGALARVQRAYDAGAQVTYGSFEYSDGRKGFAAPVVGPPRDAPWTATHLKTFRAGLFKKIQHEHLQTPDGKWLENARDQAMMFPLLEMAGDRAVYIPDVLCVYNSANSEEHRKGAPFITAERAASAYLRELPRYTRITS